MMQNGFAAWARERRRLPTGGKAVALAIACGADPARLAQGLRSFRGKALRLQLLDEVIDPDGPTRPLLAGMPLLSWDDRRGTVAAHGLRGEVLDRLAA